MHSIVHGNTHLNVKYFSFPRSGFRVIQSSKIIYQPSVYLRNTDVSGRPHKDLKGKPLMTFRTFVSWHQYRLNLVHLSPDVRKKVTLVQGENDSW